MKDDNWNGHTAGEGWPKEIEDILKPIRERLAQMRKKDDRRNRTTSKRA